MQLHHHASYLPRFIEKMQEVGLLEETTQYPSCTVTIIKAVDIYTLHTRSTYEKLVCFQFALPE
jgi:hypothetical protein